MRASTDGDCRQTVQPRETNASILDVDVDLETGKVYFKYGLVLSSIQRCDPDGGNIETLYSPSWPNPGPVVFDIDQVNRKVYFTDAGGAGSRIMRANLDGSGVEQVFDGPPPESYGIAVDPEGGKVYWTQHSFETISGSIHRVNFDGSAHEQLAVSGQIPFGIAIHHASGTVYWTDGNANDGPPVEGGIYRANLDFTNVEEIVSAVCGLRELDIDEAAGKLYFGTEVQPQGVYRCDLNGGGLVRVIVGGAYGIACVPEKLGFVCFGDANDDLQVDVDDIVSVILSWGPCRSCAQDVDGDGIVNLNDLLIVLNHWTISGT